LLQGAAGLAQYEDRCVADPAVRALRAKVATEEDESVPVEAALVTIRLTDGTSLTEHVRHGRGTPGRPMSEDELDAKVRELHGRLTARRCTGPHRRDPRDPG
jgi:2-methylcitrate dehydratase PrpD